MNFRKFIIIFLTFGLVVNLSFAAKSKKKADSITLQKPSFATFKTPNIPLSMELNFWNIKSYEGTTFLKYHQKSNIVEFYADLSNIVQQNASGWVLGYPEIFYGYKPWISNGISSEVWPLPQKVKELKDVVFSMKYQFWYKDNLPINLAMETWITKNSNATEAVSGDIEVMVWLYYNVLGPAGMKVDTVEIPIVINGEKKNIKWEVWFSKMAWDYVAFKSLELIQEGRVEIPVRAFIEKTKDIISNYSERVTVDDFDNMYVEDWEVGMEFGSPQVREARFGFKFSEFNIK